jgi:acyl-lipid omega-6 desaturase (Delta-12 desaturase)
VSAPSEDRSAPASEPAALSLKAAAAVIPLECYDNPTWRGVAAFARDWAIYLAAVALLLSSDAPAVLIAAWLIAGVTISGLFVLGHDAAHGALFRSARLNYCIGQLAMLPSLHAFEVWAYGHNVHHTFAACEGMDFVWHPTTPAQYARLPRLGKLLHRFEWSMLGGGLYYARVIWWGRILNAAAPDRLRAAFRRDRCVVGVYALAASIAVAAAGFWLHGGALGALWCWTKVLLVPWLIWNYAIGATVYIHHIAPQMAWYPRRRWNKFAGQVESSGSVRIARWLNFFWHNIYVHTPHHVDPRIPYYHLPAAARSLTRAYPDRVSVRRYRLRDYLRTTRRCKLYDFERGAWLDYDGVEAAT